MHPQTGEVIVTSELPARTSPLEPPRIGDGRVDEALSPKSPGYPRPRGAERTNRLTSREVAAAAGVSQATVSNVLNRPEIVAPATLERVRAAIEATGFVVNRPARTLRAGKSSTLGLIVLDVANPYWGEMTRGIEAAAAEDGQAVMLSSSDESPEKETRLLRLLEEQHVSGILIAPVVADSDTIESVYARGTDIVFLDRSDPSGHFTSVSVDHVHGAHLAGQHLVAMGHRQVAFVNGPRSVPWCRDRAEGFFAAFEAAGLDPSACIHEVTVPAMTARDGEGSVAAVVATRPKVTAVFCANDVLALGVLKGLTRLGMTVPADLSLVGYDDDDFAQLLSPGLTTVRQDPYAIGYRAARLHLDGQGAKERQSVVFPPVLVVRDSVRAI